MVKREARGLDAYGDPKHAEPSAYERKISTIGFEPGEYLVDVSPMGAFEPANTASKKFTVRHQDIAVASAGRPAPDLGFPRRVYGYGF